MLNIDYSVFDFIKKLYKKRRVKENIYRIWQQNRWIQISTPSKDKNVHYEYIRGHVELHFEGDECEGKYKALIDTILADVENNDFVGESWDYGYRIRYTNEVNSLAELQQTLSFVTDKLDGYFTQKEETQPIVLETNTAPITQTQDVELYTYKLRDVLEFPLRIPVYQRIYCWEERNVKCLLNDLFNHIENEQMADHPYRLGTIILHYNDKHYDIIDGQQRLITLALLLNELDVKAPLLKEKLSSRKSQEYIAYNKNLIHQYCKKLRLNNNTTNALLNAVEFSVLVVRNASLDLAYTFFSNQNSRGVPLTDYDLLKAHHLRYIPASCGLQAYRAAETWNMMIEKGRVEQESEDSSDYVTTLDTYIYHLRKWMRKQQCENRDDNYRIKREYEAAPIMDEIPPFGERFYFNEPIQGGTHFFAFVEQHLNRFRDFSRTEVYKVLHDLMRGGSFQWYRDVIEGLSFGYYLKFGDYYLSEATVAIMRIILQHRYNNSRAIKASIIEHASSSEIIMMIDQATSPTFFLAEVRNRTKDLVYPARQDMKPIQTAMRLKAKNISREIEKTMVIESFKNINL